jgi:hypothetical protein
MNKLLCVTLLSLLFIVPLTAQTDSILVGNGQFAISFNTYSLFHSLETNTWWNRSVFIYPKEVLKGASRNGTRLVGFQMFRDVARTANPPTPKVPGRYPTVASVTARVFVGNTNLTSWETIGTWDSVFLNVPMTQVLSGDMKPFIDTLNGWRTFPFLTAFNYDTTKNLAIASEFIQNVGCSGHIFWAYDSTSARSGSSDTVNRFLDFGARYVSPRSNGSSSLLNVFDGKNERRPQMRFLFRRPNSVVENVLAESVEVFPNPVASQINVQLTAQKDSDVRLYISNTVGQILTRQTVKILRGGNQVKIDVQNLPIGTYLLTLDDGEALLSRQFYKN